MKTVHIKTRIVSSIVNNAEKSFSVLLISQEREKAKISHHRRWGLRSADR